MSGQVTINVAVRQARPEDETAINGLLDALFPADPNRLTEAEFDHLGPDRPLIVLLAEVDGQVCGFTVLRERPWRPWTSVDFVGVASHAMNCGIGKKLMQATFAQVRRPIVRLFVHRSNVAARALYKRMEFRHVSTKKAHYPNGEDALVLMRWVGAKMNSRNTKYDHPLP